MQNVRTTRTWTTQLTQIQLGITLLNNEKQKEIKCHPVPLGIFNVLSRVTLPKIIL